MVDSEIGLIEVHVAPTKYNSSNGSNLMKPPEYITPSVINGGGYGHYRDQSCGSTTPLTKNCGNAIVDNSLAFEKNELDIRSACGGKNGLAGIICNPREREKRIKKKWNFSLFSCHRDRRTCLCTMVCPYVTQYRIGANSGNPKLAKCLIFIVICMIILSLLRLLPFLETYFDFPASSFVGEFKWPIYLTLVLLGVLVVGIRLYILARIRKQIREERQISGTKFLDHVTILFCFWCSLCQMKQELDRTSAGATDSESITKEPSLVQNFKDPTSPLNEDHCYAPLNAAASAQISSSNCTNTNSSSSNSDSNLNVILETPQKESTEKDRQRRNIKNSASMVVITQRDAIQVDDCDYYEQLRRFSLDEETFHCCCDCEQTSGSVCSENATATNETNSKTKIPAINLTFSL